jgi:hypothetical protein
MFKQSLATLAIGVFAATSPSLADAPAAVVVDYNDDSNWLCRPGGDDCR